MSAKKEALASFFAFIELLYCVCVLLPAGNFI